MKLVPRLASSARLLTLMIFTLGLFGCDYASKSAAKATLVSGAIPIAPAVLHGVVELRYTENDDIAFNALRHLGVPRSPALLLGLSGVAVLGIVALAVASASSRRRRVQTPAHGTPEAHESAGLIEEGSRDWLTHQVGFALVIGGALGNIVDRLVRGVVIDFIHVQGWPVFNIADIAVVVGMGLLALGQLARRRRRSEPAP